MSEPFPDRCEVCERSIDDININWCAPREPVCVMCVAIDSGPRELVKQIRAMLSSMTPDERRRTVAVVGAGYCRYCGEVETPHHHSKHF